VNNTSTIDRGLAGFDAMTFDCYGTLIDWETGILDALRPLLSPRATLQDDELLEAYARHESELEAGPYMPYREVLAAGARGVARDYGVAMSPRDAESFAASIERWPAFPDTVAALTRLQQRFRLGVITNCDDDLFALSNRRLGVRFDWIITAQQARSYKPSPRNFELAFTVIGMPRERIIHAAQSLYHDHVPAKRLGLSTAWINRRGHRAGFGATPPADARPDLTFSDLASLADYAGSEP
jgi:2-haloacid dehalogenase